MEALTQGQKRIIETSVSIIGSHGLKALTTSRLAKALRVTEPALYRHFQGKSEMLSAILGNLAESLRSLIVVSEKTPGSAFDRIESLYRGYLTMLAQSPGLSTALFSDEQFEGHPKLAAKVASILDLLHAAVTRHIENGMREGQVRTDVTASEAAWAIIGTMRLAITRWRLAKCRPDLVTQGIKALKLTQLLLTSTQPRFASSTKGGHYVAQNP